MRVVIRRPNYAPGLKECDSKGSRSFFAWVAKALDLTPDRLAFAAFTHYGFVVAYDREARARHHAANFEHDLEGIIHGSVAIYRWVQGRACEMTDENLAEIFRFFGNQFENEGLQKEEKEDDDPDL